MSFSNLLSNTLLFDFLKEEGINSPTNIQKAVIPMLIKEGASLNVIAPTGSGKTLAFMLPIAEQLKHIEDTIGMAKMGAPRAVILAPTRELVEQLNAVMKKIAHLVKFKVRKLSGGDSAKNSHLLARTTVDILIATPLRLSSALKRKELSLKDCRYIVLDEADQLFDLGFKKDLATIIENLDSEIVHMGLFSATHAPILTEIFHQAPWDRYTLKEVGFQDKNIVKAVEVKSFNIYLNAKEKMPILETFIKKEQNTKGIVFINKKEEAEKIALHIKEKFPKKKINLLHGEMSAVDRKKNLKNFLEDGDILVATDIAARGMHFPTLRWVVNYDLPFESVYYIHRSGRVGREGSSGFVYNLVTPQDANIILRINEAIKNQTAMKLTMFDEKKFKVFKPSSNAVEKTKLDKKKEKLKDLKKKFVEYKKPTKKVGPKKIGPNRSMKKR